jgi:hypothetical protein
MEHAFKPEELITKNGKSYPVVGARLSIGTINRATSEGNRHGQWATLLFTTPL